MISITVTALGIKGWFGFFKIEESFPKGKYTFGFIDEAIAVQRLRNEVEKRRGSKLPNGKILRFTVTIPREKKFKSWIKT